MGYGFRIIPFAVAWALCACVRADADHKHFDITLRPAPSALNEFARQADVTLIFSYDTVARMRSRALYGSYSVEEGLTRLLAGTSLDYRRTSEGAYLICVPEACGPASETSVTGSRDDSGNFPQPRLRSGDSVTGSNNK
jgi:outer membrane receptor for ferric coprogen and ferric-rhodotorulic acid